MSKRPETVLELRQDHILWRVTFYDNYYEAQWLSGVWHYLRDSQGNGRKFDSVDEAKAAIMSQRETLT